MSVATKENISKTLVENVENESEQSDQNTDTNKNRSSCDKNKNNEGNFSGSSMVIKVKSAIPRRKQELLKWYGWGYQDSLFKITNTAVEKSFTFTGDRYLISGKSLPYMEDFVKSLFGVDISAPPNLPTLPSTFPASRMPKNVQEQLEKIATFSLDGLDRFIRAHGQTLKDMVNVRQNTFKRIPDAVIWPETHDQVVSIVSLASEQGFVIIPFGGGTSVSGSISCPEDEPRPILVLDTSEMNSILWIDKEQLLARVQAGIVGQDLEREMRVRGFTVGHEPDSYEFSTLGGWVATRASGMKKNTYGNIEDIIVQTKVVTPVGVIEKGCRVPRMSCGPEWEQVVMGSEGCFGVVTEVTIKIRPIPQVVQHGSLVFPDWESGFYFEREVARQRLQPSSIRLMDNEQFRFGQALKPQPSWGGVLLEGLKKLYLTKIKGFDPTKLAVVTLLFEGNADDVADRHAKLNAIAARYGGIPAGKENGERGYTLTFVIAYIRDLGLSYNIVAESFETSVPWDRTLALCDNVKRRVHTECHKRSLNKYLISCRLTQSYDAGCCIYFYFGFEFSSLTLEGALHVFEQIEEAARDEIIANGGSISHHHGVGKLRKKWYTDTVSEPGRRLLVATKQTLDPNNIFAVGNMVLGDVSKQNSTIQSKL